MNTNNIAKLIYNPEIDTAQATPIYSNMCGSLVTGHIKLCPDNTAEWFFNRDTFDSDEYDSFAQSFGEWLDANDLRTACWDDSTRCDQMLARMEHSQLTWYFNANKETPLMPYADFKALVDNWLAVVPKNFQLPFAELELSDFINETGLGEMDIYSIGNMLTHYHSETWSFKCERMTIIAYRYNLDIHPLAIAMTPFVAADLLQVK